MILSRPCGGSLVVGVKRVLAFAPRRGKKMNQAASAGLTAGWVMHEYRLAASLHKNVRENHRSQLLLPHPTFTCSMCGVVCLSCCCVFLFDCNQLFPPAVHRHSKLGLVSVIANSFF